MVAVLASLGLELRLQWRRHRIRVLAAGVGVLLTLGVIGQRLLASAETGAKPAVEGEPATAVVSSPGAQAKAEPTPLEPAPLPRLQTPIPLQSLPAAPDPTPNPLLTAMGKGDNPMLIDAAVAVPERGLLQLRLSSAYTSLDPKRRRQQAQTWLERSQELGFDHLELTDTDGQTVGRRARVGSGMILLDPNPEG